MLEFCSICLICPLLRCLVLVRCPCNCFISGSRRVGSDLIRGPIRSCFMSCPVSGLAFGSTYMAICEEDPNFEIPSGVTGCDVGSYQHTRERFYQV